MKKILIKLSLIIGILFSFGIVNSFAATNYIGDIASDGEATKYDTINSGSYFSSNGSGLSNLIIKISDSLGAIFFIIATLYFLIIAINLIVSNNTEEQITNFKKGILWISIGIIVINIANAFVHQFYSPGANMGSVNLGGFATGLIQNIINPLIKLLELLTTFFFILMAIYAFYRLITSNGNEEAAKSGKMTVFYAIIGFILVKVAADLVFAVYGGCKTYVARIFGASCSINADPSRFAQIIGILINWLNSFVALTVIIMIIFNGAQIMFSNGDEEKLKKAKHSIIYIVIGIAILIFNYIILTFFL